MAVCEKRLTRDCEGGVTGEMPVACKNWLTRVILNMCRFVHQLAKVSLLIIDDFGLKPLRPPHDEDIHDLIGARYEQTTTMVTSNLDFSEWGDVFPANRMLGVATIDQKSPNLDPVRDPDFDTFQWRHYADHRWRHSAGR